MKFRLLLAAACLGLLAQRPAGAQTLVVCSEASPDFLNAQFSTANTSFDVAEQTSDRLVEMEPGTSNLIPGLAESWSIAPDGLRYTFRLRQGVKWQSSADFHPTRAFNADDVVFSFRRMMDKENPYYGSGNYPYFQGLVAPSVKAVERVDDHTVAIVLNKPFAPLLSALSVQPMSIVSAEYAAAMQKAGTPDKLDFQPIGTGPFMLVQYQKDSLIRFRAFPDYWGKTAGRKALPMVQNLVFAITPDASVRYAKLRTGECQIARYPNPADLAAMRQNPAIKVLESPLASMSYIAFRVDKKPFADRRVREALVTAVDLQNLVTAVYQGTGTPTAALVPPALWGHDDALHPRPYDPAHAKALLAEAGYPDGFALDLWAIPVTRAYMPNGRRAAEIIQADWAKIGVKARIVTFEWGEYLKRVRTDNPDVAMLGGTWDFPDPAQLLYSYWSCDAAKITKRNVGQWCYKPFDDAVTKANEITDQTQRAELYKEAQKAFYDDIPGMLFADARAYAAVRSNVEGFKIHFFGGQPFVGVSLGH